MSGSGEECSERPPRRLIVLGASNVTRSFSTIVAEARRTCPGPLELFAAHGHGRSFGMRSHVLGRGLPGILECGIWPALDRQPVLPTSGLITDIGNDVLYGVPVPRIAEWVETCAERLRARCGNVLISKLPLESLRALRPRRFQIFRALFFPGSSLSLSRAMQAAEQLNERLIRLAEGDRATLFEPRPDWYGFDPIHIQRRRMKTAWQDVFLSLHAPQERLPSAAPQPLSWMQRRRLHMLPPARRTWFGIEQRAAQPVARLHDGTTIWLY